MVGREMEQRIKGEIISIGKLNPDGRIADGWRFNGRGGIGIEVENEIVYVCGYTLAELKEICDQSGSIHAVGDGHFY